METAPIGASNKAGQKWTNDKADAARRVDTRADRDSCPRPGGVAVHVPASYVVRDSGKAV